jgi:hypothetical protein
MSETSVAPEDTAYPVMVPLPESPVSELTPTMDVEHLTQASVPDSSLSDSNAVSSQPMPVVPEDNLTQTSVPDSSFSDSDPVVPKDTSTEDPVENTPAKGVLAKSISKEPLTSSTSKPDPHLAYGFQEPTEPQEDISQEDEFDENPDLREIFGQDDDEEKVEAFQGVLIDESTTHLGVWGDAAESVRLRIRFPSNYVEPRIDVVFTIKWRDGKSSHQPRPAEPFLRLFYDQIQDVEALLVVEPKVSISSMFLAHSVMGTNMFQVSSDKEMTADRKKDTDDSTGNLASSNVKSTPKGSLSFQQALFYSVPHDQIASFDELRDMDFGGRRLENLVAKERLWVLCVTLKEDADPRFGPGLFNKTKKYGGQTATVDKLRDIFYEKTDLYFLVTGVGLQDAVQNFRRVCRDVDPIPFGDFFPKHPRHPFLQQGDLACTQTLPSIKSEVGSGFRNWYSYNTFVGYGTILEHENELQRAASGEPFEAEIQVFAVSEEKNSKSYMALVKVPSEIKRLQVGSSVYIRWQDQDMEEAIDENERKIQEGHEELMALQALQARDRWVATVIEPLPSAPLDTTALLLSRPRNESKDARQPRVVQAAKDDIYESVKMQIPQSSKQFNHFLACNHDLQHWSKDEICKELMGGDLMDLPHVNVLDGIDQDLIKRTISKGRVNVDIDTIFNDLANLHGRFFTVTGPAGSGKTYVMSLLALLLRHGASTMYPVHPEGAFGSWMPTFHNYNPEGKEVVEEPEKREFRPQVVISCPTNFLTSENCRKVQLAADEMFPSEPIMIIRIHPLELELTIATKIYTLNNRDPESSEVQDSELVSSPEAEEAMIKVLSTVHDHYLKSLSSTTSSTPGIDDTRLSMTEHSLGHRMLEVCGIIPGRPWAVSGRYRNFVEYHEERLENDGRLPEEEERAFRKSMKRLARDTLSRADIVFGTPFVLGTSLMYHSLHPTLVLIDEAGMTKESDLLPILTYYFPKAFGLFGDPKQLGPTIISNRNQNVFRAQIAVSLLSRMMLNGTKGFFLQHQHRLTGHIHTMINRLFYEGRLETDKSHNMDPDSWVSKVRAFNKERFNVNKNVVFVNVPDSEEISCSSSWANRGHILISLDIVFDLIAKFSLPPSDIVILTGYYGQQREYISELSRRNAGNPYFDWLEIKVKVIESFQGNEAPFVIFDLVRSTTMGHMRSFRRLNVGMTRGRFGLWCVYNNEAMFNSRADTRCAILREVKDNIKFYRMGTTVKLPPMDSFPDSDPETQADAKVSEPKHVRYAQERRQRVKASLDQQVIAHNDAPGTNL